MKDINDLERACDKLIAENQRLKANGDELVKALQAISEGFADESIKFTRKRQADGDPYHPANVLMCAAIAHATGGQS